MSYLIRVLARKLFQSLLNFIVITSFMLVMAVVLSIPVSLLGLGVVYLLPTSDDPSMIGNYMTFVGAGLFGAMIIAIVIAIPIKGYQITKNFWSTVKLEAKYLEAKDKY